MTYGSFEFRILANELATIVTAITFQNNDRKRYTFFHAIKNILVVAHAVAHPH